MNEGRPGRRSGPSPGGSGRQEVRRGSGSVQAALKTRMWRSSLLAILLGVLVSGSSAAGVGREIGRNFERDLGASRFVRPVGAAARITWSARVAEAGTGVFQLYRIGAGESQQIARIVPRAGMHEYRWLDRGSADTSAEYELRWHSDGGQTVVLGRLRCDRESTCRPVARPSSHSALPFDLPLSGAGAMTSWPSEPPSTNRSVLVGISGTAPADPPPWRTR